MTTIEKLKEMARHSIDRASQYDDPADADTCYEAIRLIEMQELVIQSLRNEVDQLGEFKWMYKELAK